MIQSLLAATLFMVSAQSTQSERPQPSAEQLTQEHSALLRCSAAFALVSYGQANGEAAANAWPEIDPRGREFFVRALAKIIDDTGLTRDQVAQLAEAKAQRLIDENLLDSVMPGCLLMLETSGV